MAADNTGLSIYDIFTFYILVGIGGTISIFSIIWGAAHYYARKKGKGFPLGNYAVKRILKGMYSKRGLRDPVIMEQFKDEKGDRYIRFYFSVRFPIVLFPVEVTMKYENFQKIDRLVQEIDELIKTGEIVKIDYEKDENWFPKGIKLYFDTGEVKEFKGEIAGDLIFLLSIRKMDVKKLYKRMKEWHVPGVR